VAPGASGPQAKKLTVPPGLPPAGLPVRTTWSLSLPPAVTVWPAGADEMAGVARATEKHSLEDPSPDPEYEASPE
jgi:hypothetical protein